MDSTRPTHPVKKLKRTAKKAREKIKNMLGAHAVGSQVASRESLTEDNAHSASSSSHLQVSTGPAAGGQDTIGRHTPSSSNAAQRPKSEIGVEPERINTEISRSQGLTDAANSELVKMYV
jgi:hypothetical protein